MLVLLTVFLLTLRIADAQTIASAEDLDLTIDVDDLDDVDLDDLAGLVDVAELADQSGDDVVALARPARPRRFDVSLVWRRHARRDDDGGRAVGPQAGDVRHELWLTAAWRL